jgi:dihydroorotate dehydrogenase electron transfer subunit
LSHEGSRAALEKGAVVSVERLGGGLIELTARLPHLAAHARPGEFAQLRCGPGPGPLLRRPFSVAWVEAERCSFVFEVVGAGTRLLAEMRRGDLLDSLGPLGRGFSVGVASGRVVCVSGGLGCAPFPILCRALRRRGVVDILVINGAASAARLYPAERFARGDAAIRVVEATEDGSRGRRGRVTDLLVDALDAGVAAMFACGPNPMLTALARVLEHVPWPPAIAEASLEAPMGCGFGVCLGCALPVRASSDDIAWALCCADGPVMPMRDVAWTELAELPPPNVA